MSDLFAGAPVVLDPMEVLDPVVVNPDALAQSPTVLLNPTGSGAALVYEYDMPVAQTTALFEHTLGRNPVAVQVLVDGAEVEEYSVSFPLDGQSVLVGFDISLKALIRII